MLPAGGSVSECPFFPPSFARSPKVGVVFDFAIFGLRLLFIDSCRGIFGKARPSPSPLRRSFFAPLSLSPFSLSLSPPLSLCLSPPFFGEGFSEKRGRGERGGEWGRRVTVLAAAFCSSRRGCVTAAIVRRRPFSGDGELIVMHALSKWRRQRWCSCNGE